MSGDRAAGDGPREIEAMGSKRERERVWVLLGFMSVIFLKV